MSFFKNLSINLIITIFLVSCFYKKSQATGDFLKIGIGAKNIAMGETGATSSDVNSIYWNPAGLGLIQKPEITFMHQKHFQDIYYNYSGFAHPHKIGTFAIGVYYFTIDDFQGYDEEGNKTTKINSYDFSSIIGYSKTFLNSRFSIGTGIKYIQEKLAKKYADTFIFDFGTIYYIPLEYGNLKTGLSIQNLGGKMKFFDEPSSIPEILRFGTGLFLNTNEIYNFDFETELSIFNRENSIFSLGLEFILKNFLFLRIGYISKENSGLRTGLGIKISNFMFDYAYSPYGELGDSHRFSITLKLGKTDYEKKLEIEKYYQNGLKLYEEKRYPEAVFEFNKILEIDPSNSDALHMLRKCNENLKD